MEREARELLDRIALADLVALYCRGCDRRNWALVRSLYYDDAIDHHGTMFHGGPDAFVAWLPSATACWELTTHRLLNSLFAISGDDAEGEHLVEAFHRMHPPERFEHIVRSRYLNCYQRRARRWRFLRRPLVFDGEETRRVDEAAFAELGADAPHGACDRSDPSWTLGLLAARRG